MGIDVGRRRVGMGQGIPEDQIVGLGELVQGRVAHDRRRGFLFWQL